MLLGAIGRLTGVDALLAPDIRALIPGFLDGKRRDMETMAAALGKGDFKTVQDVGHRLKGDGGTYGFDALSAYGRRLEDAGKANDAAAARLALDGLADYLRRVNVVFE